MPKKRPEYRADRAHEDFLTNLKDHLSSVDVFEEKIEKQLNTKFDLCHINEEKFNDIVDELFLTTDEKELKLLVRSKIEPVEDHLLAFISSTSTSALMT